MHSHVHTHDVIPTKDAGQILPTVLVDQHQDRPGQAHIGSLDLGPLTSALREALGGEEGIGDGEAPDAGDLEGIVAGLAAQLGLEADIAQQVAELLGSLAPVGHIAGVGEGVAQIPDLLVGRCFVGHGCGKAIAKAMQVRADDRGGGGVS